ncbi:MAG: ABC transporter permease, partial [Actinomycetales bacterium]
MRAASTPTADRRPGRSPGSTPGSRGTSVARAARPFATTAATAALAAAVVLTAGVFAFPLAYLAQGSVRLGGDLVDTLTGDRVLVPLANSFALATTVALACAGLGTAAAVAVSRTDLPGRGVLRTGLAIPLAVPSFVGATALLAGTGPGGLLPFVPRPDGFVGAAVVLTLLSYPYVYLPVLARLATLSRETEEAARLLGAGPWRGLVTVVLPQLRPAVSAGALLAFLYVLSDFGAVALLRYDTITRAIFATRLTDRATSLTLGLVLAVLALVVAALAAPRRRDPAGP